jgi:DNA-binding CsgD family transcriptional regulator
VIADPAGLPVSGPVTTRFSVPEFRDIYLAGGGPAVDPTPAHAAQSTNPIVVDPELAPELIRAAPKGGRRIAEYLLDNRINRQVCLPGRDSATGAPFAINLIYEHCSPGQLQRALAAQLPLVQRAKQIFWEFIQDAAFFCDEPGLTNRERQALLLIVRGCTLVETAERLGTSVRMAERLLAGARRKLGARNNAQAVYRAIVYRAL